MPIFNVDDEVTKLCRSVNLVARNYWKNVRFYYLLRLHEESKPKQGLTQLRKHDSVIKLRDFSRVKNNIKYFYLSVKQLRINNINAKVHDQVCLFSPHVELPEVIWKNGWPIVV